MVNSGRVGKAQEQAIVRHAKANGFPGADRIIRTGAGKGYAVRADEGDIWLCPGVIIQSKRLSPPNRMERTVRAWLTDTERQRLAACADYALLVVRREGTADIGEWWAWLDLYSLLRLLAKNGVLNPSHTAHMPVRLTVADAYTLLRAAGYGTPLGEDT